MWLKAGRGSSSRPGSTFVELDDLTDALEIVEQILEWNLNMV